MSCTARHAFHENKSSFFEKFSVWLFTFPAKNKLFNILFNFLVNTGCSNLCSHNNTILFQLTRSCKFFENIFENVLRFSSESICDLMKVADDSSISLKVSTNFWNSKSFFFDNCFRKHFVCLFNKCLIIINHRQEEREGIFKCNGHLAERKYVIKTFI